MSGVIPNKIAHNLTTKSGFVSDFVTKKEILKLRNDFLRATGKCFKKTTYLLYLHLLGEIKSIKTTVSSTLTDNF